MQTETRRAAEVTLAHPIPVLIVYATVIVSEDGVGSFYDDIFSGAPMLLLIRLWRTAYPLSPHSLRAN